MILLVCFCAAGRVDGPLGDWPGLLKQKVVGHSGPWWNRTPVYETTRAHVHPIAGPVTS